MNILNRVALRRLVVFDPLKIIITNYPEDKTEMLVGEENPEDENSKSRELPFQSGNFILNAKISWRIRQRNIFDYRPCRPFVSRVRT